MHEATKQEGFRRFPRIIILILYRNIVRTNFTANENTDGTCTLNFRAILIATIRLRKPDTTKNTTTPPELVESKRKKTSCKISDAETPIAKNKTVALTNGIGSRRVNPIGESGPKVQYHACKGEIILRNSTHLYEWLQTTYLLECVNCSPTKMRSTEMRRNKTKCHLVRAK